MPWGLSEKPGTFAISWLRVLPAPRCFPDCQVEDAGCLGCRSRPLAWIQDATCMCPGSAVKCHCCLRFLDGQGARAQDWKVDGDRVFPGFGQPFPALPRPRYLAQVQARTWSRPPCAVMRRPGALPTYALDRFLACPDCPVSSIARAYLGRRMWTGEVVPGLLACIHVQDACPVAPGHGRPGRPG